MSTKRIVLVSKIIALGAFFFVLLSKNNSLAYNPQTTEPRGAAALSAFDRLPYFKSGTTIAQVSSYDRTGGNSDGGGFSMYKNPVTGGYVVLEDTRPGTIYRIWATGLQGGNLRMYFDQDTTPRVDIPINDFFSGTFSPFLFPLVGNDLVSSGGFYSYYPFSFRQGIRVEFTAPPRYYQITYHLYNTTDNVVSFSGTEDLSAAYQAWNNSYLDPKEKTNNQTVSLPSFNLPAGETKVIFETLGQGSLRSTVLKLPQLFTTQYPAGKTITDNGKAHKGVSSFTATIEAENTGVVLERRLDHAIANQTADVYVDDQLVGRWSNSGSDPLYPWRDSRFQIPQIYTQGKASIAIKVQFISSGNDWNEFFYWVKTIKATGEEIQTDILDIGMIDSETAHNYIISGQTWEGTRTYSYPSEIPTRFDAATLDVLSNTYLRIFWDEETTPGVDIPIGFFFGVGSSGEGLVKGLLMGTDPKNHTFYNYFPMPYTKSAKVYLVNNSRTNITAAEAQIQYNTIPYEGLGTAAGYFTAIYNQQNPTLDGKDYVALNIPSGKGHIVGIVMNISKYPGDHILEGDERIFIDTTEFGPSIHGTGTEDIFNGGWYFNKGIFTLPVHGAPLKHGLDGTGHTDMYRLSLADTYPFEKSILYNVEHCGIDECNAYYESAVFAYMIKDKESLVQTDSFSVGNPSDEQSHNYNILGQTWEGTFSGTYVGRAPQDSKTFTGTGRAHKGSSNFTINVLPDNSGVRLGRILDFASGNQKTNVYVDGVLAGVWFNGGKNPTHRASFDYFEIPQGLTQNKSSLEVKLEFLGGEPDWNEFVYYVYSRLNTTPTTTPTPTPTPVVQNFMHINSITMYLQHFFGNWQAAAVVKIVNQKGEPVSGVSVNGVWSETVSKTTAVVTDNQGRAIFKSGRVTTNQREAKLTFTFTVSDVVKDGWIYDQAADTQKKASITTP